MLYNKVMLNIFMICSIFVINTAAASNKKISFSPTYGVFIEVTANDQQVTVEIKNKNSIARERFLVATEKSLDINADDYNFDGKTDFSISHIDDGMGTYIIHQIYIYSAKKNRFIKLTPKCGDQFINVIVSKKRRMLTNSYIVDNEYKTCSMKY